MSQSPPDRDAKTTYWLDDSKNVDKIVYGLYAVCGLLLAVDLLDLFGVLYHKHAHYRLEGWFGFYGFYGLFGSVGLVLAAKQLRKLLMRREDYYDE